MAHPQDARRTSQWLGSAAGDRTERPQDGSENVVQLPVGGDEDRDSASPVPQPTCPLPLISVVIPAHNEAGNLPDLIYEVVAAFAGRNDFEILVVDDASTDSTATQLAALQTRVPRLRVLRHQHNAGQSMALINGVRLARGRWIGTLDGDGQNDPADLPRLLAEIERRDDPTLKLIQGWRVGRRDSAIKRLSSKVANAVRGGLLRDATPDSGCGIRVVERAALLQAPAFDHMHRFIPALIRQAGWRVDSLQVNHRPRTAGHSHYGTFDRLWVGIVDLVGVAWLGRRTRTTTVVERAPA